MPSSLRFEVFVLPMMTLCSSAPTFSPMITLCSSARFHREQYDAFESKVRRIRPHCFCSFCEQSRRKIANFTHADGSFPRLFKSICSLLGPSQISREDLTGKIMIRMTLCSTLVGFRFEVFLLIDDDALFRSSYRPRTVFSWNRSRYYYYYYY